MLAEIRSTAREVQAQTHLDVAHSCYSPCGRCRVMDGDAQDGETPIDRGLEGRVVLVTGGGSGIGRASAIAFAGGGARVVVSDVDPDGGEETVQLIEELGGESMFVPADVSDGEQVVRLIAATLDRYGRLDCAHNNGGIEGPLASVVDLAEDDWNRVIDINLKGIWWC